MKKDIDTLKKRSRRRRGVVEQAGSASLALSGLVGMFFLVVLVWQIAIPTFIDGENGEISAASEYIPISDYVLEWDHPNVNEQGELKTEPIILILAWEGQNGPQTHELEIVVTANRGDKEDIQISEEGLSTISVEVGKKTKFYLKSVLEVPVSVEQRSGPVPAADASGNPQVSSFVVSGDVAVLFSNGKAVFEPLEMAGWTSLLVLTFIVSRPNERRLAPFVRCYERERQIRSVTLLLAIFTAVIGQGTLSAFLGGMCWLLFGVALVRTTEGMKRLQNQGRTLTEVKRLKHSISDREGLLMWSRMLLVSACFFIPLDIDIPFLTERYQDIFQPYASGIRSAFLGTVWVMSIAMLFSMPLSIGAAIYLEEYASPTRTTKLIQALVTNLAGVPSIVFGMFGLAIFVKQGGVGLGLGPSILAAGLTMGVMAMPIIVLASQEALRSVPRSLRESAYGVGCTQWQVVKHHVLPSAMPGIMTGSILAMSRIMGEAAPLVVVGAAALVLFDPEPLAALTGGNLNFTVIPIQIYFWTSEPEHAWHSMAAAASIALILLLIAMNSIAIVLRQHFRKRLNS